MWIICESGDAVNLSSATHLEVAKSADYKDEDEAALPFVVLARFGFHSFWRVVCTRDTEEECYQTIIDITEQMCGWIDPTQQP